VITGYGTRAFSAGADIGIFPKTLGKREAAVKLARDSSVVHQFIDQMDKPVVAAANGMTLGGGVELAIRCHSIVALSHATFQFPEITLGILPGIGGSVVPYRKWPEGAALFHEMICFARKITAQEAADIGMVKQIKGDYVRAEEVLLPPIKEGQGKGAKISDNKVDIPEVAVPHEPMAGNMPLSKEALSITVKTIQRAAAADSLAKALEINYQGAGEIACTEAAREGITAFLEKRRPEFKK